MLDFLHWFFVLLAPIAPLIVYGLIIFVLLAVGFCIAALFTKWEDKSTG